MTYRKSTMMLCSSCLPLLTGTIPVVHAQLAPTSNSPQAEAAAPQAGDAPSSAVAEIIVTAQRRSENLQKVPISVAVVTADTLQSNGVTGMQSIKLTAPGVEVQANNGSAVPIIRGVGSKALGAGIESPVAIYVDGVYLAAPTSTVLSFNNISQIEVLKGPQGTLFGRNATGGLIQISTRDPQQELGGEFNVGYGNYQTFTGTGYLTGGLTNDLAADIAVSATTMGTGYGNNLLSGKDVYRTYHDVGVRSKWVWKPGPDTTIRFIADYADNKNSMSASRIPPGGTAPAPFLFSYGGGRWDINADQEPRIRNKQGGVSLRVDQSVGGASLASITAYRRAQFNANFDLDYTPVRGRHIDYEQRDRQFSQELQLLSPTGGFISWVAGAYYFHSSSQYPFVSVFFDGPAVIPTVPATIESVTSSTQRTDSISGFGQATANLLDGLKATAGLRYTSEKRTLADATTINVRADGTQAVAVPLSTRDVRFKKLTWRLSLDYQVSRATLVYVSYNRGFKSGGFNPGALTIGAFEPEVLDAYESGIKTSLFDRRVRANAAGFYYDYKNVQVNRIVNGATGIYNGAKAIIYGFEADLDGRVTSRLDIHVGYQFLHTKYDSFPNAVIATPRPAGGYALSVGDVSGNRTVLSPKSTLSVNASYKLPLGKNDLSLTAGYYYNSGYFHEPDNVVRQPAYALVNASARYALNNGWSILVWGNNLTNRAVAVLDGVQSFGATGAGRVNYAPPRTYGATIGYKF